MDDITTVLGRLRFDEALDGPGREQLTLTSEPRCWVADGTGTGLEVHPPVDADLAAADLRRLIRDICRPRGIRVDGVVVLAGAEDRVCSITVHANRVTMKQLWPPGVGSTRPADRSTATDRATRRELERERCAVIDLATRTRWR